MRRIVALQKHVQQIWNNSSRCYTTAALYIHWPYCKRRCTYCNFNKYIDKFVDHERMKSCIIKEAETLICMAGVEEITSVFFGGGTPSLAKPDSIKSILDAICSKGLVSNTCEVSMEVNPSLLEIENLMAFKNAGVNRVSIGVQTLNSSGLNILGRDHSAEESLRCLEMAKSLFPGRVSVDLIFGWPGQTFNMWISELDQILMLCDNHISLYQLTLERGTQLYKQVHNGSLIAVESLVMEEMYLQAVDMLTSRGFERYEVSNFARQKCYSQHNLSYWTGHQYIGVGPGAHGRFKPVNKDLREARIQTLEPNDWMWEVEKCGHATRKLTTLSILQQLEELLVVGLRIKHGITNAVWSKICPEKSLKEMLLPSPDVKSLVHQGLLIFSDDHSTRYGSYNMRIF
uniref:Radical S-adenosyl methionine domain-containing protein 1, mitochondrial n=1 Tax=Arion vulgaris TaxID=1028688 RepID=A0A0B7AGX1_9EUPU